MGMRRIDYIRATAGFLHDEGIRGSNPITSPYRAEFGILPRDEIVRILRKLPEGDTRTNKLKDTIVFCDIETHLRIRWTGKLGRLSRYMEGRHEFTPKTLRRISRMLLLLERGQVVKRDWKIIYLDEPTKKPDIVMRVHIGDTGKPTIVRVDALPVVKQMPKLFQSFTLPGER
jgi:hypothetical protein